jgi:hypothetical protein
LDNFEHMIQAMKNYYFQCNCALSMTVSVKLV